MASNFKHNKKRNSGLTYEFLVRQLAGQMIDRDLVGSSRTLRLVKEYFSAGQLLAEERELFDTIVGTRSVNEITARRILSEIGRAAAKMDGRLLDIKKSNLIKDVHHGFGKGFFDNYRLPHYRLLASIQMFLDSHRSRGRLSENVQKIHLEEGLVKWMTSSIDISPKFNQDREIDGLVTTMATKKFQERYGKEFSGNQKALLEKYSQAVLDGDLDTVAQKLYEDKRLILNEMRAHQDDPLVRKDAVTSERFFDAYHRLNEMNVSRVNDETVEEMLLYWKLAEELKSNG